MNHYFYVPRGVVMLMRQREAPSNPCVCVKLPYRGYEISLSLDSSHGPGDLRRGDFRVYESLTNADLTNKVEVAAGTNILQGSLEDLLFIKQWIDSQHESTSDSPGGV